MVLDDRTRRRLMLAGAGAVTFNAPLGASRVETIAGFIGENAGTVVDLGCGAGALAIETVGRWPDLHCLGIDSDAEVIARARAAAADGGFGDRLRFEVGDMADLVEPADAAVCIGATHGFGGEGATMAALIALGRSVAVVGDGVWVAPPDPEHRELFGDLPDGEDGLADLASAAGWTVVDRSVSTLEEWDDFEFGWIEGARLAGGPEAEAFADRRLEQYRWYRGVLGFGWLLLRRQT